MSGYSYFNYDQMTIFEVEVHSEQLELLKDAADEYNWDAIKSEVEPLFKLGGIQSNQVDAAIGELLPGVQYKAEVCQIGQIEEVGKAEEDMQVRKHGRTTGLTEGIVTDETYDALVGMDHSDPSIVALFKNQMRIEPISPYPVFGLGGDSGSLVINKSKVEAVGLYFAGPPSGVYGIANHIADVLSELQIELL